MPPNKTALQRYGRAVRDAREQAGLTQDALAHKVQSRKSSISDIERGVWAPSPQFRAALEDALGDGRLGRIWTEVTGSGRPPWLEEVTQLIAQAGTVHDYQCLTFPGYLQTEAYAKAIYRNGARWLSPDEVSAKASERARVGERFAAAITPLSVVVLDETVLQRRYGSAEVVGEQLRYVASLVERERITLHIVPARSLGHPGVSGAFIVITADHNVVYAESVHEGHIITEPRDVSRYRTLHGALLGEALDPRQSLALLHQEIERVEDERLA